MTQMVVEIARQLRSRPTDAEKRIWSHLRNRQLDGHRFRRQAPIDPYIVDFVCFERRLIIEIDGGQHTEQGDAARTQYLTDAGFRILRFWNNDALANPEGVIESILQALRADPPPHPSPARGEGD